MNYIFYCLIFLNTGIFGQIIIDENFDDWSSVSTYISDDTGDVVTGKIDFSVLKVDNDSDYLYLTFDTGEEINLQDNNQVVLLIDIDNNVNSGFSYNGIGADFVYEFGSRYGYYYRNGSTYSVYHSDIELMSLPTVTSDTFEMAFKRKFYADNYLVVLGNTIKVIVYDQSTGGDIIPDMSGGYSYQMKDNSSFVPLDLITRPDEDLLRIMSYNVEFDGYFDNEPPYQRLIKAISPDILCFQEIYDHTSAQVKTKIESYFGGTWYHSKIGDDLIVVSKYKIEDSYEIGGNAAFLIDLSDNKKILVINAHLYCCDNDSGRQKEVDQIMNFIRNSKAGTAAINIDENTPIVITGDMNFVGYNRQRKTLIYGDIFTESVYGSDFLPDWDNTYFEDALPRNLSYPACFTWNSPSSSYPSGRLDYFIYSGSVMTLENSFALSTDVSLEIFWININ
ncbi:MAG: endonuclease/exonuclease/phosphatase family protein [Saprospiraceae bacterium]